MSLIAANLHKALTHNACSAALRFEEAFIEFIESGEQRMVIDESLTGFGVRLCCFYACLKFCELQRPCSSASLTRARLRNLALLPPFRIPNVRLTHCCKIIVQYKVHCTCPVGFGCNRDGQPVSHIWHGSDMLCAIAEVHCAQGGEAVRP